jgi:hypothetical protein
VKLIKRLFGLGSFLCGSFCSRSLLYGSLCNGCFLGGSLGSLGGLFGCSGLSGTTATACLLLCLGCLCHILIEVYKLDESYGSSVALTQTEFDNARVASGTVSHLCSNLSKQLFNSFLVLQITENNTAAVGVILL